MPEWFLAPSLARLRDEVDAKWPKRSKKSDGSVGDSAHAARKSEHNPANDGPGGLPDGVVTAIDITATNTALREAILKAAIGNSRVWYCINQGHIWSRTYGWKKQAYNGSNPHKDHIHISLVQSVEAVNDTSSWGIAPVAEDKPKPAPKPSPKPKPTAKVPPTLQRGSKGPEVSTLQRFLGVKGPGLGTFGPRTQRAVKRYQRRQGLVVDGIVGKNTWTKILSALKYPPYNA